MPNKPSAQIEAIRIKYDRMISTQIKSRAYRASNELRNASQLVLRGQRSGKRYIVPGTGRVKYYKRKKTATISYRRYAASAPGEPPAVRTGAFRAGWQPKTYIDNGSITNTVVRSSIENRVRVKNGHLLGEYLEDGTGKMAPRPHHKRIQDKALPNIMRIFKEPYF